MGQGRRRLALVALGLILALLVAELVTRAATADAPPALEWSNYEAQNKIEAMRDTGSIDVAFVGSSTMNAAANTHLVDEATGLSSFNAALQGMDLRSMEFWISNIVVPRLRPKVLVIGVTSREFNDNGKVQERLYQALVGSKGAKRLLGTESVIERTDRILSERFALVRHRSFLRSPLRIVDGDPEVDKGRIDARGNLNSMRRRQGISYYVPQQVLTTAPKDTYNDYAAGGDQIDALKRIAASLEREGIEFVLVKLPVTDDVLRYHPNGADDHERYERTLDAFVRATDVRFVNADAAIIERSDFADPNHLGENGMRRFAEMLAPWIKDAILRR